MSTKVKILSVNVSGTKGTAKHPVDFIELNGMGIAGDAHAGSWHRQVSLLGVESIEKFNKANNLGIKYGDFAENITTQGFDLYQSIPGDKLVGAGVELEVTQIGKVCHADGCAIFSQVGSCIMPREGIFARVIQTGRLKAGDELELIPRTYRVKVVTLSDRASRGDYEDRSGPEVLRFVNQFFDEVGWRHSIDAVIIPDDAATLKSTLVDASNKGYDLLITTGGTGIGPRDITPDVVKPLLDKEIPGIMEMIRMKYGADKPNALISRSVAGLMGSMFVYTLPGSIKAVGEYMQEINKIQKHLFLMFMGIDSH